MNFEIVERVVQYIDENYHSDITNEIIEEITGFSAGYVRNEFKKIINIPIDEYRAKRQLALIIKEIQELNCDLKNSNLLPWSNENSFTKAFKEKYGITPKRFVKNYQDNVLQARIDVSEKELSYNNDVQTIESLERKLGSKKNALLYIFSLKPYALNGIDLMFALSGVNIKEILIKRKYEQSIGMKLFNGVVPKDSYSNQSKLLETFYDLRILRTLIEQFDSNNDIDKVLSNKYIVVKNNLKKILLESIGLENIINDSTNPCDLLTLWYEDVKLEKVRDDMIYMPNELIDANLSMMKSLILQELVIQEQGLKDYNSMEDLRSELEFDFNKPINEECNKCKYKNKCTDDSDCLHYESLNESEREEYFNKPGYEILTIESLCKEIKELIIDGLLYFSYHG